MQRVWRAHEQWSTPFALCTLHFALCRQKSEKAADAAQMSVANSALWELRVHTLERDRDEFRNKSTQLIDENEQVPHSPSTHHTLHSHWFLYFSTASSFTLFSFFLPHSYAAKFDALSATRSTSCVFFIYFRLHLFFFLFPSFTSLPLWKLNMWRMISNV